jgi:hypothetical protein
VFGVSRFYQNKHVIIVDTRYGDRHAWSPNRILEEILHRIGDASIADLADIDVTNLMDKSLLQYSVVDGTWKAVPLLKLRELGDVDVSELADGRLPIYDANTETFKFVDFHNFSKLSQLVDLDLTNLGDEYVIKYDNVNNKFYTAPSTLDWEEFVF